MNNYGTEASNAYQNQYATAGLQVKSECPQTEVEQILNKIKRIGGEIAESSSVLEAFVERTMGPRTAPPTGPADLRPVRSGQIGQIQDALDAVQNELGRLRMAQNSLASIA